MVLLNVFADGTVAFARRPAAGKATQEVKAQAGSFPIRLRLESAEGRLIASWKTPQTDWQSIGEADVPYATVGFATSANHLQQVAAASVSQYKLKEK